MIPEDVLSRLPASARAKLLLIDGLAADSLDAARSGQARLNDIARRRGGPVDGDPNVARLTALIPVQNERHETLASVAAACVRWCRGLADGVELEPIAHPSPDLAKGESIEAKVIALRAKIAELTLDKLAAAQAPPPKADLRKQVRPFVDRLAKRATPRLILQRGRPFEAQWADDRRDFGLSESFVGGLAAWLDPERFTQRLEAMVDALPEKGALSDSEQAKRLKALGAEIEALERDEEALIERAYAQGLDILRRRNAHPSAVLGVKVVTAHAAQRAAAE
jgi:hypothetical protein